MTHRRLLRRLALGLAATSALALPASYAALRVRPRLASTPGDLPPQASVAPTTSAFAKQGPDQCGAYSTALGLSLLGHPALGPDMVQEISHAVQGSRSLSGTFPWAIRRAVRQRDLDDRACTARNLPRDQRLAALCSHLADNQPVVVLIESERGSQHYVLALGYSLTGVDIYDPNHDADPDHPDRTRDDNGPRPGNRTLDRDAFLDLWSRGGGAGLYTWWYLPLRTPQE